MTVDEVTARIGEIGIVPVIRAATVSEAIRAVEAISAGGIPIVEITMTVPNAISLIHQVAGSCGAGLLVGAGTITTAEQAKLSIDAGAKFIVSPGLSVPVLSVAQACGVLAIPGALTPTEIMLAQDSGAKVIKIFPCDNVGGPKYLKALKGPFPNLALLPTGGVSTSNAAEFIAAGAFALGVGGELVNRTALKEGNSAKITQAAREFVRVILSARESMLASSGPAH
jgi:2-dehydro-3-deoxyphosphogluconate aldolase / (4S)-4-hydroxy-2-oxoglutarate aldolase